MSEFSLCLTIAPLTEPELYNRKGKRVFTPLPDLQLGGSGMDRWTREKHKKIWANRVIAAVFDAGGPPPKPLTRAKIEGIRYCIGNPPDVINVYSSFKCLVDALQVPHPEKPKGCKIGASVIVEDDPQTLIDGEIYRSVRVRTKAEQRITLSIEGVFE